MTVPRHLAGCYRHFEKRVHERIGPQVNAGYLWDALIDQINRPVPTPHVTFIVRMSRKGRRLWRFYLDGEARFVIFDHRLGCPITILKAERGTRPQGKGQFNLEKFL